MVALANAAFAASRGGDLVLRIDDTDRARSSSEDEAEVLWLLRWLGIGWTEGPLRQSERGDRYAQALDQLLDAGAAYPCFCGDARLAELRDAQLRAGMPPRYDGRCRSLQPGDAVRSLEAGAPHVLRFAVPEGRDVEVDDCVRGAVLVPAGSFGDPILRRADGTSGYLLASVVDDVEMEITHVIRGEDHLPNTARQLLLFEALGATHVPQFAHLPLLRDDDGAKLSKRAPLGTLDELVDEGFLPVTVRRYLASLLGQGPVDLLPEAADEAPCFSLDRIPTGAPKVDRMRLESLGREDLQQLPTDELLAASGIELTPDAEPLVRELAALCPSRVHLRGELRLVFDGPGPGDLPMVLRIVLGDGERLLHADRALELAVIELRAELQATDDQPPGQRWTGRLLAALRGAGADAGMSARDVLLPLRIALTGTTGGPGIELVLSAIGAREALRRVHLARVILEEERQQGGAAAVPG